MDDESNNNKKQQPFSIKYFILLFFFVQRNETWICILLQSGKFFTSYLVYSETGWLPLLNISKSTAIFVVVFFYLTTNTEMIYDLGSFLCFSYVDFVVPHTSGEKKDLYIYSKKQKLTFTNPFMFLFSNQSTSACCHTK